MDLVSIGHILKETICWPDGRRQLVLGSPAAYSSVCAGRLGARVGIVSRVGKDMPPELLRAFDDAGVDQTGLDRNAPATTTNELGHDSLGRKRILRYLRKAPPITLDCFPETYADSRVFYCCGVDFEIQLELIEKLASLGGLMASDIGGLGGTGLIEGRPSPLEQDATGYRRLISHFKIMKASEDDCMILSGGGPDCVGGLIDRILSWGPEVVLLTRGAEGTDIYTKYGIQQVPAAPSTAVDTTGAGDCLMSGFLLRYAQTENLLESVRFGSTVASFVVERTGGVTADRMPTSSQAEQRMHSRYS